MFLRPLLGVGCVPWGARLWARCFASALPRARLAVFVDWARLGTRLPILPLEISTFAARVVVLAAATKALRAKHTGRHYLLRAAQMLPAENTAFSRSSSALLAVSLDELATARLVVGQLEVVEGLGGFLRSSRWERVLTRETCGGLASNRRHAVKDGTGTKQVETGEKERARSGKIGAAGSGGTRSEQPTANSQTIADISRHVDTGVRWQQAVANFSPWQQRLRAEYLQRRSDFCEHA